MNGDLESELAAAPELRALVESLRSAPQALVGEDFTAGVMAAVRAERKRRWPWCLRSAILLPAAAALAVCLALAGVFRSQPVYSASYLVACQRSDGLFSESSAAPYMQAFAVTALAKDAKGTKAALDSAVDALVREQNAEGGWANASLSARNVAALQAAATVGATGAGRAYKRGLRYLRTHGIGELTAADFVREARYALARIDQNERALVCGAALCAN